MHTFGPAIAQFLLHSSACKIAPGLVKESAKLIQTGYPNHHWRGVCHISETLFAFAQCGVPLLPIVNVLDYCDEVLRTIFLISYQGSIQTAPKDRLILSNVTLLHGVERNLACQKLAPSSEDSL